MRYPLGNQVVLARFVNGKPRLCLYIAYDVNEDILPSTSDPKADVGDSLLGDFPARSVVHPSLCSLCH